MTVDDWDRRASSSRRGRALRRDRALRVGQWLLALGIVFPALALGAIHTTILCITAVLVAASTAFVWMSATPTRPRMATSVLLATGVGLTLYTLFQIVPLPAGVVHLLAPRNADVWSRALLPLHVSGPSWVSLSLDPVAGGIEVLRGIMYVCAFLSVVRLSAHREGALFCSAVLVVSATIVGVAGLLHPAMGAEKVFGIYRPVTLIAARHVAPILNANALAAYVNIGIFIALGEGMAPRTAIPRPISLALAAVLIAIEFWLASRGGIVSLVLGVALLVWLTRISSRAHRHNLKYVTYAVLMGVCAASIAMWVLASSDDAWAELADKNVSKLKIYRYVLHMIESSPVFGTGRGTFESAFPAFREQTGYMTFTHPENVLLQWGAEWGLPVSLAAMLAIAWAVRPKTLFSRSRPAIGAQVAIVASFLHNLVDFSSEFPAVVLALAVCAGLITGGSGVGSFRKIDAWAKRPRWIAWGALGATALAGLLVLPHMGEDLFSDRTEVEAAAIKPEPREDFENRVRAMMLRHPAEPYLPFAGALRASIARDDSVLPWVGRTLELAPVYAPAHFILARSLTRISPSQARLEYRYALTQAPDFVFQVASESAPLITGPREALEMIPEGAPGLKVLIALTERLGDRLPATQASLDDEILRQKPDAKDSVARKARAAAHDLEEPELAPWCEGSHLDACVQAAIAGAERLQAVEPTHCEGHLLEARARARAGEIPRAVRELEGKVDHLDDPTPCLIEVVTLAKQGHMEAAVAGVPDKLSRVECIDDVHCANQLVYAAQMEKELGNPRRALVFYRRACERYPTRDDIAQSRAEAASELGLHAEALDGYNDLARRHPEEPRWSTDAERERQALVASPLRGRIP